MGVESVQPKVSETLFKKSLASQLVPVKLEVVSDQSSLPASVCEPIKVVARAQNGLASGPSSDLAFTMAADSGKFYEDEKCSKEQAQFILPTGYSSKSLFYKSGPLKVGATAESLRLIASTKYFASVGGVPSTYVTVLSLINTPPKLENADFQTAEDSTLTAQLKATDENGDPLTFQYLSSPNHYTSWNLSSSGLLMYQPEANYNGIVSFSYQVSDGRTNSGPRTITIGVSPVNDLPSFGLMNVGPFPERQTAGTPGADINLSNYVNDIDTNVNLNEAYTEILSFEIITAPTKGAATLNGSILNYKATVFSNKPDFVDVKVTDRAGVSATGRVNISMAPFNNTPTAANSSLELIETNSAVVSSLDLATLIGDIDTDPNLNQNPQNAPTISIVQGPTRGTYSLASKQYTAYADYSGHDTIVYRAIDANNVALFAQGTISINIQPTNDLPTASDVTVNDVYEETPKTILLGSDVDLDPVKNEVVTDSLTIIVTQSPNKGSYNSSLRQYSPNPNQSGSDSFQYKVRDLSGAESSVKTVNITIINTPDAPTLTSIDPKTGAVEDMDYNLSFDQVNTNLNDPDPGQPSGFKVKSIMAGSTLRRGGTPLVVGSTFAIGDVLTWHPPSNIYGSALAAFSLSGWDGALESASPVIARVTVAAVNDAPVANAITMEILTTDTASLFLWGNDVDSLPAGFSYNVIPPPISQGSVTGTGQNWVFDPAQDFVGLVNFSYTISDDFIPSATSLPAPISIDVGDGHPKVVNNNTLNAPPPNSVVITSAHLLSKIYGVPSFPLSEIIYTLGSSLPLHGALKLNGVDIGTGSTFTQADINLGKLRYHPDGSGAATDSFTFDVRKLVPLDVSATYTFNIQR